MDFEIDRKRAVKGRRTNSIHDNSEFKGTLDAVLRGGRMTKHKGVAASFAPEKGMPVPLLRSAAGGCAGVLLANHTLAISLAPAALLMSSTSAIAQDACVEVDPNTFECVDNGAPATATQVVTGNDVSVDIQEGFDIDATGDGIDVNTTGGVTITSSGSMNFITSGGSGVIVDNSVAGDLILDVSPSVIDAATSGVFARNDGDGLTSVTTGSVRSTSAFGIFVIGDAGTSDLIIDTSAGLVQSSGAAAIFAASYGSGVTSITTGEIVMPAGIGLTANHQGTDLIIDTTGGMIDAPATAVSVSNNGTGYSRVTTGDLTGVLSVSHRGSSAEIDTRAGTASAGVIVQNAGTGPLSLTTGNVGSSSNNGIFVNNQPGSAGPVTIDTSAGAVNAAAAGIDVRGTGTGALSITTANVDAGTGAGVYARTYGESVTIDTSAGAVSSASGYGLRAITFSPGQTDIVTGDVSGALSAAGINAIGGTGVSFDSTAGTLTGGLFGVFVRNYGAGNAYVTTADVYGNGGDAIFVDTGTDAGDVIINSAAGVAIGSADGIEVINRGTGAVSVTTGDVTGGSDIGIDLYNQSGTDITLDSSAGAVSGVRFGVYARNDGTGDVNVTTGDVTAAGAVSLSAVRVRNLSEGLVTVDTSAGSISGDQEGVGIRQLASGAVSLTTGDVSASGGTAVFVSHSTMTGDYGDEDITINTSAGSVSGSFYGIYVRQPGTGNLSITSADVAGGTAGGIEARVSASSVTIDSSAGTVSGGNGGIGVQQQGAGTVSITSADVMSGVNGINVSSVNDTGDIAVNSSAGAVTATQYGIIVSNRGTGSSTVIAADVNATNSAGIRVDNYNAASTGVVIDTSAGAIIGGTSGIRVRNDGTGDTQITVNDVTGQGGDGISAFTINNAGAGNVLIQGSSGDVIGASNGIYTRTAGTDITIDNLDSVTGQNGYGIDATSVGGAITISNIGAISGTQDGIRAFSEGGDISVQGVGLSGGVAGSGLSGIVASAGGGVGGNINVGGSNALGDISGADNGIRAYTNGAGSILIDTSAGRVSSGLEGIEASIFGTGSLTITTADVVSSYSNAITASSGGGDQTIDTSAGTITAAASGIYARQYGAGSISITTADVYTNTEGIRVRSQVSAKDITIDTSAGTVMSGAYGVGVRNYGTGNLSITTADVRSDSNRGIYANNFGGSIFIDTSAGAISASSAGLYILNNGTGETRIVVGDVTGGDDGILAYAYSTGDITINTTGGTVSGFNEGIEAQHEGTGSIAITTADVNAATFDGIFAETQASSGGITINTVAGTVTAERLGIFAIQQGTGTLSITTADVNSNTSFGVYGGTRSVSTDLTIDTTAGAVMATQNGVDARHQGSGALSIATGDVSSAADRGVYATNTTSGSSVSIDTSAGSVAGSTDGIYARQNGAGTLSITTADVSGTDSEGIEARTDLGAADALIDTTAGAVAGLLSGILVNHNGSGAVTINTADVDGTNSIGVELISDGAELAVNTSAGRVSGGNFGIRVFDTGAGSATIRTGDVIANSGTAISAVFGETKDDVLIDVSAGTVTGTTNGITSSNNGTGSTTLITADVIGQSFLGLGFDAFGTDLLIDTTAGTVTGQLTGLSSINSGTGRHDILTGDVTGVASVGVLLTNFGTDLEVNTSAGSVTGGTEGIRVTQAGSGSTTITTADVTGQSGNAIAAYTDGTDLTIDTTAGVVSAQLRGVLAYHTGTGAIAITTGAITAAAGDGVFVSNVARETATNVSVNTSGGQVAGYYDGIEVFNYGTGATSVITADVTATLDDAVYARSEGTTLTIDTSAGALSGTGQGIEAINNGTGATTITVNDVTSTGAEAIFAQNSTADTALIVRGSSGDIIGATDGVVLRTAGGDITVENLDSVTGQAGHGLDLTNAGVTLTVSDIGTITGTGGIGVLADTVNGAVSIQALGLVGGVSGTGDFGIFATGASIDIGGLTAIGDVMGAVAGISATSTDPGDLLINTSAGAVSGGTNGVLVTAVGAGDLSVTTADISSETGSALALSNSASSGDIVVNASAGSVSGGTYGVAIDNLGTGSTTITTGNVTGAGASGIRAVNQASATDLTIDTSLGAVTGSSDGVGASNLGTGALVILTGDVTGTSDDGVMAFNSAAGTDLTLDTSAGAVTAADLGLSAANEGSGATMVVAADVTSANVGINAITSAQTTSLTVNSAAGAVVGDSIGVLASHYGSGAASITTADVTSADGIAINAMSASGDITIDSSGGSLAGGERAIEVQSLGAGAIDIVTANATGTDDLAIMAYSLGGDIAINTALGDVTGTNAGIAAMQLGTGDLSITAADVTASAGNAVHAVSGAEAGAVAIDASAGVLMGGANGVYAQHQGAGDLSITALSAVGGINGVLTNQTLGGAQSINLADATGMTNAGVSASTTGTGLAIAITGTVMGNEAGVIANNSGAGETTITSSGVIMATSGEAIRVTGASANVTNDGLITGFVTLGDGDDSFTNNGDFSASADSAFGGGANLFTNNGLFAVTGPGPIALNGLSSFANTGIISLVDNTFGNGLTLSGDFNGSADSALAIDLSFETTQADVLTIAGAATGSTLVEINLLGSVTSTTFDDILIVDAGAGSEAGAFSVAGGRQEIGLLRYEVAFDGAVDDYFIVSVPTEEALQTSNFAEGARNLWGQSLQIWSNQLANLRGGKSAGSSNLGGGGEGSARAWFAANASEISRDRVETFTSNLLTTVVDLGYDQDFLGFQGGVDFGNDALRYGVTGGYLRSEYEFSSSSDRINYDVLNVGAYLTLDTGAFFANVLVKYDSIEGSIEGTSGLLDGDADGSTFGARGEIGTLLGDRSGLFAEPSASLSWIDANLDDIGTAQGEFEFSEDSSLLGRFGARVGSGFASGQTTGIAYIGAHYVSEFQGDDGVVFISSGRAETFAARPFEDFVEARAGVSLGSDEASWSGGVEGHVLFGDDLDGFGVSANIQYRF